MKIIKALILIFTITVFSCDSNDDETTPNPTNPSTTLDGFTYNEDNTNPTFYETANAYIEIDVDNNDAYPLAPDYYSFFFTNGRLLDNDANVNGTTDELLLSTNTTEFVRLKVDVATHSSLQTGIPPMAGVTYVVTSEDSIVITNVGVDSSSPQTFVNFGGNNVEFGEGNDTNSTIHLPASLGHSITINAINLDNTNPTNSTIDVDYTFVNASGELISGHYEGTLGVFED